MAPKWHNDFLAVYPYLLKELGDIPQVAMVKEAKDLEMISGDEPEEVPFERAVYVVLDKFAPVTENDNKRANGVEIGFSVILVMEQYTPEIDGVGAILTAIIKRLQGFEPKDENANYLTTSPFEWVAGMSMRYENGFAYFPLRFVTTVAVIANL